MSRWICNTPVCPPLHMVILLHYPVVDWRKKSIFCFPKLCAHVLYYSLTCWCLGSFCIRLHEFPKGCMFLHHPVYLLTLFDLVDWKRCLKRGSGTGGKTLKWTRFSVSARLLKDSFAVFSQITGRWLSTSCDFVFCHSSRMLYHSCSF